MSAILLTVWKRGDKVKKLINSLKINRPSKVYISCDGPRDGYPDDYKEVNQVKKSIEELIDWDCSIFKLYNDKNLGCRGAMTKAINWFFENEEEGIILEEDCIPHKDFIPFCSKLLERYRENKKIWSISGTNLQDQITRGEGSYYFSIHFNCWGWATWKDRWIKFDSNLKNWPYSKKNKLLYELFDNYEEIKYWTKIFDNLYKYQKPDSWAYRFHFSSFLNKALNIIPNKNLIENIGFDKNATNTTFNLNKSRIYEGIIPIIYPKHTTRDFNADEYIFNNHYKTTFKKRLKILIKMPLFYPKKIKFYLFSLGKKFFKLIS